MTMKRLLLSALCAVPAFCMGQTLLYNDGAMIKVQTGATLYVEGGIHNTTSGTIDNDGMIEVKGNFINEGTWDAAQANTLKFSGNVDSQVSPGSAVFHDVIIQKDATFNVVLAQQMTAAGHMTVNNNLNFNAAGASRIVTGNFDLKMGATASVTGADADEYVATTGTGMMQKTVTANGTFAFPIGDLTNYSPISSTYTGSAYAAANIRTKANDAVHPDKPTDATEYITRYWDVNATGITGYSNTLTGTYIPADLTLGGGGTAAQVKGAVYDGTEWSYAAAASGANIVIGSTNDATADFTGTNFFGKVDLKVFLQGPYSAGSMNINLPTVPTFPLTSPYPDAPATVSSIPANTTDWIKLELRQVGSPGTILGKGSAFVKNDGSIVGLDGTSFARIKNGEPTALVAVFHRNHLPIRTDIGLNTVMPTLHDFTTGLGQAYDNPGIANNDAMIDLGSGVYGLFRGNVNNDLSINVLDSGLTKTNSNPSQNNVYSPYDVNFDKNVNVLDSGLAKTASNPTKSAHL